MSGKITTNEGEKSFNVCLEVKREKQKNKKRKKIKHMKDFSGVFKLLNKFEFCIN